MDRAANGDLDRESRELRRGKGIGMAMRKGGVKLPRTARGRRNDRGRAARIALLIFVLIGTLPGKAMAGSGSITGPLLISAAVTGAVAAVLLIAIMAGDSEGKGDFLAARAPSARRVDAAGGGRLRLACASGTDGGIALLCW